MTSPEDKIVDLLSRAEEKVDTEQVFAFASTYLQPQQTMREYLNGIDDCDTQALRRMKHDFYRLRNFHTSFRAEHYINIVNRIHEINDQAEVEDDFF